MCIRLTFITQAVSRQRPDTQKRKEWDVMCPSIAEVFGLMSKGEPCWVRLCVCSYTYVWSLEYLQFSLYITTQLLKHSQWGHRESTHTENTETLLKNTKILPLFSCTECPKNSPGSENILLLIQSAWLQRAAPLSQPLETSTALMFAQILPTDSYTTRYYDD